MTTPEEIPLGGRLKFFREVWQNKIRDQWVIQVVTQGLLIEFTQRPPRRFFISRLPKQHLNREKFLTVIQGLAAAGTIQPVPDSDKGRGYYSNLFMVPKKDGSLRPILDLKSLNPLVKRCHFKMESIQSVLGAMEYGEFLTVIDVKEAYLHIPIHPAHHKFLRFYVAGQHWQFVALPFGLSSAPRTFTKVMAAALEELRLQGIMVIPYLDDLLVKGPSPEIAERHTTLVLETLTSFGWLINYNKSNLHPSQTTEYLGLVLDSKKGRAFLPTDKIKTLQNRIQVLQQNNRVPLRTAMQTLGTMVASFPAIPYAQFHTRTLQQWILKLQRKDRQNLDRKAVIPTAVKLSLDWWSHPNRAPLGKPFPNHCWTVLTTDASLRGWGGVLEQRTVQGVWNQDERLLPINLLELRAIHHSLVRLTPFLQGKAVRIQSDNVTAVAYINHQGGTRSPMALLEASRILSWAEINVPALSAVHIPGVENWIADYLSRETIDQGEWSLHPEVFQLIVARWGLPDIDLMASRHNRKVQRFVARSLDPQAHAVDALVIPWDFPLTYIFPPLALLPKVIKKVKRENTTTILIAPHWPRRSWFADIVALARDKPFRLPQREDLLAQGPIVHPSSHQWALTAWLLKP